MKQTEGAPLIGLRFTLELIYRDHFLVRFITRVKQRHPMAADVTTGKSSAASTKWYSYQHVRHTVV